MEGLTRRQFGRGTAVTAALVCASGVFGLSYALGGSPSQAFSVRHGDGVKVRIGNGKRFTVEVVDRSTGDVLEVHQEQTVGSVLAMNSDLVTFHRIAPPRA